MRHPWTLAHNPVGFFAVGPTMTVVDELLEIDGPILRILRAPNQQLYLALAIDRERGLTRWVHSPISHLQLTALMRGGLSVKDALIAPSKVLIVDYDNSDVPVRRWEVEPSTIPDSCLPVRDALLPFDVRQEFAAQSAERPALSFHLAGETISEDAIPFGKLSAMTKTLQGLFAALAEFFHVPVPQLAAAGLHPGGSMVIEVKGGGDESFARMINHYHLLASATYDPERLNEILTQASKRVADSYGDYLKFVELNKVEVLADWPTGAAYLGFRGAHRARPDVTTAAIQLTPPVTTRFIELRGYFEGFASHKGLFEFYDLTDAETYTGGVDPALKRQIASDTRFEMTLSKGTQKYDVKIEVETRRDRKRPKYTLVAYREVSEDPHLPNT